MRRARIVAAMERCDVLIIGAGPAGAAAGVTLARAGLGVTIVDRAFFPRTKTCGDALSERAVALLRALVGARAESLPRAEVRSAAAILPGGPRIVRRCSGDPGWIVRRLDLDACLRDAAEEAGAEVIEGVNVRELLRERGVVIGAAAGERRWRASVVIAADGPASIAWSALGLEKPREQQLAVAATTYMRGVTMAEMGCSEHYFERALPNGYGWVFPAIDGWSNVGVYQREDSFHAGGRRLRDLLAEFIARHPERFASATAGEVHAWPLPLRRTPRAPAGCPGLLLAGDAARLVDPLSGEGIWQALRSGQITGEVAAASLAREGRVGAAALGRLRRRVSLELGLPCWLKGQIQDAMRVIVEHGLARHTALSWALQRGYGGAVEPEEEVLR